MKYSALVFAALAATAAAENATPPNQSKGLRGHDVDEVLSEVRDLKKTDAQKKAKAAKKAARAAKKAKKAARAGGGGGGGGGGDGNGCKDPNFGGPDCTIPNRSGGTNRAGIYARTAVCSELTSNGAPKTRQTLTAKDIHKAPLMEEGPAAGRVVVDMPETYCMEDDECPISCCCWTNGALANPAGESVRCCLDLEAEPLVWPAAPAGCRGMLAIPGIPGGGPPAGGLGPGI